MKKNMKSVASRLFVLFAVIFTLGFGMTMPAITAVMNDEPVTISASDCELIPSIHAHAEGEASGGTVNAETGWNNVIKFFVTWIGRIGGVVAFVGAVMFALSIKNNDAEQKQQGLLTMIAGFVAFAVTGITSYFGIIG